MKRIGRMLRYPPVFVTLIIMVAVLVLGVLNNAQAPQRLSPGVRAALAEKEVVLSVVVQLDFKSERYHTDYFQQQGRIARANANAIWLRGVPAENVRAMARNYWITRISLESEVQ